MTLKQRMRNKEKLIGMYVEMTDIVSAKIAGLAGYDYVWVDTEHACMSYETLLGHVIALQATGTPVVVRASQDDLTSTKKILEMGVDGIIFPMVKTPEEANRLIASTLYPPHGNRGFGPRNACDYGYKDAMAYARESVDGIARFIQIEHRETVENLDEIMKNEFIDGYVFGPCDLSGSYDVLGDVYGEKITAVIRTTIERLHANGKYAMVAAAGCTESILQHWHDLGADMITAGTDFDFIRESAVRNCENMKRIHKGL